MKCDELKKFRIVLSTEGYFSGQVEWFKNVYDAKEVDAAIAELKQTIDELVGVKKSAEQILQNLLDCGLIKEWYFNGTFNVVLKADDPHPQIAELKQKLENVQASMYADVVDANMENRRLKRALWLARAQAADGFATISRWTDYEDMHPDTKIGYRKWYKKFMHVKALCKAKAEEYK